MPRAFLVKNTQPRRATIVNNTSANMTNRDHLDDRTTDEHPTQLANCKNTCSVPDAEHNREKNGRTLTEVAHEALFHGIYKERKAGIW